MCHKLNAMKVILFISCLFFSILINAQTINFEDPNSKTLNSVIFNTLKQYGEYTHDTLLFDQNRIYKTIKRNRGILSLYELSSKINSKILNTSDTTFIIGIMDTVQCKNLKTYQEISSKYKSHWDDPSDELYMEMLLFRDNWGDKIMPVNFYDKKTGICYIFVCFQ